MVNYEIALCHYGVKGQKWGIRNYQYINGTWTEEGKRRRRIGDNSNRSSSTHNDSSTHGRNDISSDKERTYTLDPKLKKALMIGAAIAGTGLVAYGGYKIYQISYHNANPDLRVFKNGLPLKNSVESIESDLSKINPGRVSISSDIKNYEIIPGSSQNCMLCTTAYDLRRRGYDVSAGFSKRGFIPDQLFSEIYKDANPSEVYFSFERMKNIEKTLGMGFENIHKDRHIKTNEELLSDRLLELGGNGSRGNVCVTWAGGIFGGHSMIWENVDGKIVFMDGQTNHIYKNFQKEILDNTVGPVTILRTDNLELNYDALKKYINTSDAKTTYVDKAPNIVAKYVKKAAKVGAVIYSGSVYIKSIKKMSNKNQEASKYVKNSNSNLKKSVQYNSSKIY